MVVKTLTGSAEAKASASDLCARASQAGFDAVALHIGRGQSVSLESTDTQCCEIRATVETGGLRVAALCLAFDPSCHYGSRNPATHHQAIERTRAALDRAAWLGAETLAVVPAIVTGTSTDREQACSYAQALNGTYAALKRLRFSAERCGVSVAVTPARNRFLLSPVELCELIDEQHSADIGAGLDLAACQAVGWPEDWIRTLASRIRCVCLTKPADIPAPSSSLEPPAEFAPAYRALLDLGYSGPICCAGEQAVRRLTDAVERVHSA